MIVVEVQREAKNWRVGLMAGCGASALSEDSSLPFGRTISCQMKRARRAAVSSDVSMKAEMERLTKLRAAS